MKGGSARIQRAARYAVGVSAFLLLVIGVAYYLTYEPSAQVGVTWRLGITTEQRREHERRFALANRRIVQGRMQYDLLDMRKQNIEVLVSETDVLDTDGIDRAGLDLPVDYRYGVKWTWVGFRLPLLREPGVLPAVVALSLLTFVASVSILGLKRGAIGDRRGGVS